MKTRLTDEQLVSNGHDLRATPRPSLRMLPGQKRRMLQKRYENKADRASAQIARFIEGFGWR